MDYQFVKENLKSNPDLVRMIFQFNSRLSQHIHASQINFLPSDLYSTVFGDQGLPNRISELMLNELIRSRFLVSSCWDFSSPRRRILLLENEKSVSLRQHLAALIYWPEISREINRSDLKAFQNELGEQAYRFAETTAQLAFKESNLVRFIKTEVVKLGPKTKQVSLATGVAMLILIEPEEGEMKSRLKLKVGLSDSEFDAIEDISARSRKLDNTTEDSNRLWKSIFKILTTVIAPESQKCFR